MDADPIPPQDPLPIQAPDDTNHDQLNKNVVDNQSLQSAAHSITNQALQFLSTASNETIGACLVGLGATTYLVLGRVGLVLMGVVGGVVLHATWEGTDVGVAEAKEAEDKRRREVGLDVVRRALTWQSKRSGKTEYDSDDKVEVFTTKHLNFGAYPPETAEAMASLTDAVIRDYVKWWYSPVLPTELLFPSTCRQTFTAFLLSLANHLSRKRPADLFLEFVTHSSSILVVFLNELSVAINASPNSSTQEAVVDYLETRPESNLSYVVNTEHQHKKLHLVAEDIMESYLEHKSYNCEPVRIFCREVLAKVILEMTIESCSRAEFINEWIVYLLEDPPEDVKTNTKSGGTSLNNTNSTKGLELPTIPESAEQRRHKRVVSKAQEAMDEAMKEAARLTQMIAEQDAKRSESQQGGEPVQEAMPTESIATVSSSATLADDASESTNQGIHTPTSSHSDHLRQDDSPPSFPALPPRSEPLVEAELPKPEDKSSNGFTTFDQIIPHEKPTALLEEQERQKRELPPLTLQNASVVIMDDSDPNDRSSMRSKPNTEYLIQVEPSISHYSGWMIVRKLQDFEALHQVLFRIARITEAKKFAETHAHLPIWRGTTKSRFKDELERYLIDAIQHRSLADCEGMKRFLEKDQAMSKVPNKQNPLNAIENVGKGVIDVLSQAPKGVAGGGKALIGGVGSVLGANRTPKRVSTTESPGAGRSSISLASSNLGRTDGNIGTTASARQSQDSLGTSSPTPIITSQPGIVAQMERRPSSIAEIETKPKSPPSWATEPIPILGGDQILNLPPPPSAIPDDYVEMKTKEIPTSSRQSFDHIPLRTSTSTASSSAIDLLKHSLPESPLRKPKPFKPREILTEQEAQISVELGLACITELYKLSSAWSVRLAFLNAAKSILLRPGNAQLDSIRQLLQDSLDSYSSDAGIAHLINKTRENSLPTESERAAWPAERTPEQREELRRKARGLLVERGMPQALNSVMGSAASGEALGRVFDALQVQRVARGLVFGVMLQALRAVTQ